MFSVEDSDDVIEIEAPTISRRHARITVGDSVTLEDLGSKNGTWLNDEQLTAPRALAEGDIVRLGSATFTFHLARQPKATESADIRRHDVDEQLRLDVPPSTFHFVASRSVSPGFAGISVHHSKISGWSKDFHGGNRHASPDRNTVGGRKCELDATRLSRRSCGVGLRRFYCWAR